MWPRMPALENSELLPQGEDLQTRIVAEAEKGTQVLEESEDKLTYGSWGRKPNRMGYSPRLLRIVR